MKRLFVLAIGLGLVSSNTYTAPFYKVQCYDSKYNVVSCDDKAKVAKTKKIARVFKKKSVKKETASERKARERAMALRELARQNETLKGELDSLRKANLIASAKTSVAPTTQAAPVVQASVPAPLATPMPTAATQIAKSIDTEEKSTWGFEATNWIYKGFNSATDAKTQAQVSSPIQNELDLAAKYIPQSNMIFTAEEDIYWNWNNTTNADSNGFFGDNPAFYFDYIGLYTSESKKTTLNGEIKVVPGINQSSRDRGMIAQFYLIAKMKSTFNDGKGYFKFETEVDPAINKYTTSAPTATTATDSMPVFNGLAYENLTPNTRFAVAANTVLGHRLVEGVTLEGSIKMTSANKFASEITDTAGVNHTLTPEGWSTKMRVRFPQVIVSVSDRFTVMGILEADCNDISKDFKLYAADSNNNVTFFFVMDYAI